MAALWIIPALAVIWVIWVFNRFVRQRNVLKEAWSGIDVQLKRRHDLVPNLSAAVQGYSTHEKGVFIGVARSRSEAQAATGAASAEKPEAELSAGLRQLLVLAEAYPELRASANFQQLSRQLVETEDQLQYARRYYNGAARDLNNLAESFPTNLVGKAIGIVPAPFFAVESAVETQAPEVRL